MTLTDFLKNAWPGTATSNSHVRKQNAACNKDIKLKTMFNKDI